MLSVIIIAKNEEENLPKCLESVKWADEIIVFDSGSTDNTVEIAKKYTRKVFCTDWQGYGIQKQRALERATGDWILSIDADEWVSTGLQQEIAKTLQNTHLDAYRIPIYMEFYGRQLKYSHSPKNHIRLFRREGARFSSNIVHESIILPKPFNVGQLQSGLIHQSFKDLSHALEKLNRYSSASASIRIQNLKKVSLIKTLSSSLWMFFRCYFVQGGILEGRDGFVLAVLSAENSFYRGIKMMYQDKTP